MAPEALIAIAGPTGSGKSRLALALAGRVGGEIINYDSVQIYRGFDIGSAKPPLSERQELPHHLFDFVDPADEFNAADYQHAADRALATVWQREAVPIAVGGTFFYLRALLHGLPDLPPADPAIRARIRSISRSDRGRARLQHLLARVDPPTNARLPEADRQRRERALEVWFLSGRPISSWSAVTNATPPRHPHILVALQLERSVLIERLDRRVIAMYKQGLLEETASLLSRYPSTARPFAAIGYAEAVRHLSGELSIDAAIEETQRRTRAYAKRQMTWLRSERDVLWLHAATSLEAMIETIEETLLRRMKHQ